MAMYWTCKYNANHDIGERCDCERERAIADAEMHRLTRMEEKTKQIAFNFKEAEEHEKAACY